MIAQVYKDVFAVLKEKPTTLWGISLLFGLLCALAWFLCGPVIALSLAIVLALTAQMAVIFLYGLRRQEVHCVNLFDVFKDGKTLKRVLCGMAWRELWIFLWALIPIVGIIFAIIRTYEYRLTPYILILEPDVRATEAIKVSKARTVGWKGKMFGADILVVGIIVVAFIILGVLAMIPYIGILFSIIFFLAYIFVILFVPLFLGLVEADFYEKINASLAQQEAESDLVCPDCGAHFAPGSAFCSGCGRKLM